MTQTIWRGLETIPGLVGASAVWRAQLGEDFERFSVFLRNASSWPRAVKDKEEEVPGWMERPLPPSEPIWELRWEKLAQALCKGFGLRSTIGEFPLPATREIGS